jgi:HK97 family phage prohead protease
MSSVILRDLRNSRHDDVHRSGLVTKLMESTALTLADARQVRVRCSSENPDRVGDVVVQAGIDFSIYQASNPVILFNHDPDRPVARSIRMGLVAGELQSTAQFPPEGEDADADWVYGKIKSGIINAASIGFIPIDYVPLDPKSPWSGLRFDHIQLLEFSFVSIPANADAVIIGRNMEAARQKQFMPAGGRRSSRNVNDHEAHDSIRATLRKLNRRIR